ncbi:GntR family transcriptional regulator [Streptomyces sp. NPDC089799]|uniref:GntR family transcriptional regulator n=1 Tax=Streptomyces sp. NPDC089799 TaxID=3155066 RepID=UPI00343930DA
MNPLAVTAEGSSDPRPLHARIAADLRAEIMSGQLPAGTKLPSTNQLRTRFDASNATIQKALVLLKTEGLVVGRAGAAVSVRENRQRTVRPAESFAAAVPGKRFPWLARAAEQGGSAHSTLLAVERTQITGDVAAALDIADGETVVLRSQLISIDGEPAELVSSYYPLDVAHGTPLSEGRRIRGGTPTLLRELGHTPGLSVDRVTACTATQEQYAALRLPGDLPVLRTLRTVYTVEGKPIEVTVMVKAGHLYELQYEFTPE